MKPHTTPPPHCGTSTSREPAARAVIDGLCLFASGGPKESLSGAQALSVLADLDWVLTICGDETIDADHAAALRVLTGVLRAAAAGLRVVTVLRAAAATGLRGVAVLRVAAAAAGLRVVAVLRDVVVVLAAARFATDAALRAAGLRAAAVFVVAARRLVVAVFAAAGLRAAVAFFAAVRAGALTVFAAAFGLMAVFAAGLRVAVAFVGAAARLAGARRVEARTAMPWARGVEPASP
jgi:hypothetical protein